MPYPTITLSESNFEIDDCAVIHALKNLFINIRLRDGKAWDYVEVTDYSQGFLWLAANHDGEDTTYQLIVPITSIETIVYT